MAEKETIEILEKEKAKIDEKIKLLKEQKDKVDFIVIDGWAYETKEHDFSKTLSQIKIPKGKELWTYEDCIKLHNNPNFRKSLNLETCWFFIKQHFKLNEEKNFVEWFIAGSGGADLNCNGDSDDSYSSLGIRLKWKVQKCSLVH